MRDPLDPIPFPFIPDKDELELIQFLRDHCRPDAAGELADYIKANPDASPDDLVAFIRTMGIDKPDPPRAG